MTQQTFIKRFNTGNARDRSDLFIELDLKQADYNVCLPLPDGSPYIAFFLVGYKKVKAAVWYVLTHDERRLPIAAFKIHKKAVDTYSEWAKTVPNKKFAHMFKLDVVAGFEEKPTYYISAN